MEGLSLQCDRREYRQRGIQRVYVVQSCGGRTACAGIPHLKLLVLELARREFIWLARVRAGAGNSGARKTHVALAIALAACQKGYRVQFTTAASLHSTDFLYLSHANNFSYHGDRFSRGSKLSILEPVQKKMRPKPVDCILLMKGGIIYAFFFEQYGSVLVVPVSLVLQTEHNRGPLFDHFGKDLEATSRTTPKRDAGFLFCLQTLACSVVRKIGSGGHRGLFA